VRKRQYKPDSDIQPNETWLIPYADLLTLLLALFVVLFASSQIDQKKFEEIRKSFQAAFTGGVSFMENVTPIPSGNEIGVAVYGSEVRRRVSDSPPDVTKSETEQLIRQETEQLLELKEQIDAYIRENGLTTELETYLDERQLRITISDHALFDSGSAQLKPESRALAEALAGMLVDYPDYEVVVAGHTDNVPIRTAQYPSNFHLSAARALSFMSVLLENEKVNPERFYSVGYGEYRPVADNGTPEGRAKNRRVEVSIVRTIQVQ